MVKFRANVLAFKIKSLDHDPLMTWVSACLELKAVDVPYFLYLVVSIVPFGGSTYTLMNRKCVGLI